MKYFITAVILLIIFVGLGGYIYVHSKDPIVKDSDGKDIYQHGLIFKRTLLDYEVIEGDVCISNSSVLEKFLWPENGDIELPNRALSTYNAEFCSKGCQEGACLR